MKALLLIALVSTQGICGPLIDLGDGMLLNPTTGGMYLHDKYSDIATPINKKSHGTQVIMNSDLDAAVVIDTQPKKSRQTNRPARAAVKNPSPEQQSQPKQEMPISIIYLPRPGSIIQIHYKECFVQTQKTDGTEYQVVRMPNCAPKKTPLYHALDEYVRGERRGLGDLLSYYDR